MIIFQVTIVDNDVANAHFITKINLNKLKQMTQQLSKIEDQSSFNFLLGLKKNLKEYRHVKGCQLTGQPLDCCLLYCMASCGVLLVPNACDG